MLFTGGDATGVLTGKFWLEQHDLPLIAMAGALTASPLATREAEQATSMPIYNMEQLANPDIALELLELDREPQARQATA